VRADRARRRRGVVAAFAVAMGALISAPAFASGFVTGSAPSAPRTLYVAPGGSDAATGTSARPFRSIRCAVAAATKGSTVVVNSGVYRESLGTVSVPMTIEAAPHANVVLSGADVVNGWSAVSGGWVHHNWTVQFCHTCYDSRALDPAHPYAGLPDMAFVNGKPLAQVGARKALGPGTFYVDYAAHDLYIGNNPTGPHTVVEAAARVTAALFAKGAAGSAVRGIQFEDYAPDWETTVNPAMVLDEAPNMTFANDVFTGSASRGLSVYASGTHVVASAFVANGFTGFHADKADHLVFDGNLVEGNNTEKWWPGFSPVASVSGVKIATSYHVLIEHNVVNDNDGNGIWFDVSSYDANVVDNVAANNFRHGIYIEITGTAVVASNVSVGNGQTGLKLSDATSARVYNNTLAGNLRYQLMVDDDGRVNTDPAGIALGITWVSAHNSFANNVLATPDTAHSGPVLFTEDLNNPPKHDASTMIVGMIDDVFARSSAHRSTVLAWWTHPAPASPTKNSTLHAFQQSTGYEAGGIEYTGYSTSPIFVAPQKGNYALRPGTALIGSGTPLPRDVAALIGVSCAGTSGTQCTNSVNRGALVYP
jgi:hypothetical protein